MAEQPPGPGEGSSSSGDWRALHLWQIQGVRDVLVGLGIVGLFWLGQKISIVTVPLLLAILFAYLFEPVIRKLLARTKLRRRGAVSLVLASAILVIVVPSGLGLAFGVAQAAGLVQRVADQTRITLSAVDKGAELREAQADLAGGQAGEDAPTRDEVDKLEREYRSQLEFVEAEAGQTFRWLAETLFDADEGETLTGALTTVQRWLAMNAEEIATAGAGALRTTLGFLGSAFGLAFGAFITAFFFFFVATGWVEVQDFGRKLIPDKHRDLVMDLLVKFDRVISGFIRGRLTIAFVQAIVFTIGYLIIGVPAAFILGPLVAILSIVPYLALLGLPISIGLLAIAGHEGFRGQWWWYLGAPTAIYFLGQALDDYLLTPLIQGKSTDMSTPMILFASLAGGALFGVFGLLIAIPIAACLKILVQEIFWPHFKDWAEGRERDFLPIGRGGDS